MIEVTIKDQILIAAIATLPTSAMGQKTLEQLESAIDRVNADPDLKGMILTGQGRFFCTGFDLRTFLAFEDTTRAGAFFADADRVFWKLFCCTKPVISAMNGHAVAGGLIIAMAGDYRIVSDHARVKVGMSEIKIGVPLSTIQTAIMRWGVGCDRTLRNLLYFGTLIDGPTALQWHVVDECLPTEAIIPRAAAVISEWMDTPGRPFVRMKQELKKEAAGRMEKELDRTDLADRSRALDFFFHTDVQAALARTQAAME